MARLAARRPSPSPESETLADDTASLNKQKPVWLARGFDEGFGRDVREYPKAGADRLDDRFAPEADADACAW
jgi:hypothetical protein